MSMYVISSIKRNNKLVGFRILYEDTGNIKNCSEKQVMQFLQDGGDIRNLELENGRFSWSQGAIDRYPVIDADTLQIIDNKDALIVLGYIDDKELGNDFCIYSVANYLGQTVEIEERRLIKYAGQYQLANCKLVPKNGPMQFIASLGGELRHMKTEVVWEYSIDTGVIICNLPDVAITKLVIPSRINGDKVLYPSEIVVIPQNKAINVRHIKVSEGILNIDGKLFESFKRLKSLDIDGSIDYLLGNMQDNIYLEKIRVKKLNNDGIQTRFFRGLSRLETVNIESGLRIINNGVFDGCTRLDVSSVLKEGVLEIRKEAFANCGMAEITIPSTVSNIDVSTFNGCKNLRKVVVKAPQVNFKINAHDDNKVKMLFHGCNSIEVYVKYGNSIRDYVTDNVKIHEAEPNEGDLRSENISRKASILGIDIRSHGVAKYPDEVLGILMSMTDEDWRKIVTDMLIDSKNGVNTNILRGVTGLKFLTRGIAAYRSKIGRIQMSKNHAIVWDNKTIQVVFIDLEFCKKAIESIVEYRKRNDITRADYVYRLPELEVVNSSRNPVENIEILSKESFKVIRKYHTDEEEIHYYDFRSRTY